MSNKKIKLCDSINVLSDFQYSINIEYDLFSDTKIKNYIPTASAIDIIEDVMLSTSPKSTDRARIFVGAYGKGKSHLSLMLIALLCRKEKHLYQNLLSMICETKPELCKYINAYQESNQKLLPVVIQGSSIGIRQAFLLELRKALQTNGMGDIMPNTYFSAAINAIQTWKHQYKDTYEAFKKAISCSTTEFITELGQFNNAYYDKFIEIYPTLTSGSEFNPVNGMNIVELYNDVNEKIRAYGYTGIFVVYDEFSKFLSGNLRKTSSDEIEVLQYFAENCNRSGNKQMHIMLISHQSILSYVDKLPKSKVDSWKAVSNRYKSIELNTSASQIYEITSRVIKKDPIWFDEFVDANRSVFEDLYKKWSGKRLFSELTENEMHQVIWGCYPLEPCTTFLLPKISEKIAQNERTLFTFLSASGQRNTLPEFLAEVSDKKVPLITPDRIFDYFEPLFKAEAYDKPIHKYWKSATIALGKLPKNKLLERKIIKTLALIYIYDRVDVLSPDVDTIISIYNGSVNDIQEVITALTFLTDNGLVRKLENKKQLRISEHTEQNVDALINDATEKVSSSLDVIDILNAFSGAKVLYPNSYNDDNEIVRYFDFRFITSQALMQHSSFEYELGNTAAAGIVFAVIINTESRDLLVEKVRSFTDSRVIFIISKEQDDIVHNAYRFEAIKNLIANSTDDVLNEELQYSLADAEESLLGYIDTYLKPELDASVYYSNGEALNIHRKSSLSRKLSDICSDVFRECPVINNEVINKDTISGQATNSRAKVIDGILSNELKPNLGLIGSGQDVSFMRSTLKVTGVYLENDGEPSLTMTGLSDNRLENVFMAIKNFVISTSAEGIKNFSALYEILVDPANRIGMKKGVIPIYIAVVLHFYKKYVVIMKNGKEMEINARLLEAINNCPSDYDVYLEQWDSLKEQYITELEASFNQYIRPVEKEFNTFDYIVRAIQRWYLQLPKYVKEIRNIYLGNGQLEPCEVSAIRFLNSLRAPEINARDYLFNRMLWIFDAEAFSPEIANRLGMLKEYIDGIKRNLVFALSCDLKSVFGGNYVSKEASLPSVVMDWTSGFDNDVTTHAFNNSDNTLLNICLNITPDSDKFVEDMARASTGLRIDDWGEVTIDGFTRAVRGFVDTINAYNTKLKYAGKEVSAGSYKITYIDDAGEETYKTFDKSDLSDMAKLLFNDVEAMLTEEYGESLSSNEKRQVLIEIISKLLN